MLNECKYLGVLFNHNRRFRKGEGASNQGLESDDRTSRKHDLSVDTQIELFNKMVVPVVRCGCEIWGDSIIREVEFFNHVLCMHRYNISYIWRVRRLPRYNY